MQRFLSSSLTTALTMLTRNDKKMDLPATVPDEEGFDVVDRKLSFENVQNASKGEAGNVMDPPPVVPTHVEFASETKDCIDSHSSASKLSNLSLKPDDVDDSVLDQVNNSGVSPFEDSHDDGTPAMPAPHAPILAAPPMIVVETVLDEDDDSAFESNDPCSPGFTNLDLPSPIIAGKATSPLAGAPQVLVDPASSRPELPQVKGPADSKETCSLSFAEASKEETTAFPRRIGWTSWRSKLIMRYGGLGLALVIGIHVKNCSSSWWGVSENNFDAEAVTLVPPGSLLAVDVLGLGGHDSSVPLFAGAALENDFDAGNTALVPPCARLVDDGNELRHDSSPMLFEGAAVGALGDDFDAGAATFVPPNVCLVFDSDELGRGSSARFFEDAALFEASLATHRNFTSSIPDDVPDARQGRDLVATEGPVDAVDLQVQQIEGLSGAQVVHDTPGPSRFSSVVVVPQAAADEIDGQAKPDISESDATGALSFNAVAGLGAVLLVIAQGISMLTQRKSNTKGATLQGASSRGGFLSKLLRVGPKLERTGRRSNLRAGLGLEMKNYVCLTSKDVRYILQEVFGRDAPSRYSKNELVGMVVKEYLFHLEHQKKSEIHKILQHKGVSVPSSASKSQMMNAALEAGF